MSRILPIAAAVVLIASCGGSSSKASNTTLAPALAPAASAGPTTAVTTTATTAVMPAAATAATATTTATAATTTASAATTAPTTAVPRLASAAKFKTVSDDALYVPPSPLPAGKPGDIIQITDPTVITGGAVQYKVLYLSTTAKGAPTAVSGLVIVPPTLKPDAPVMSYTHGTVGMADKCAPSKNGQQGEPQSAAQEFVGAGYVVAATDYEGLGTPGVHTYVVGRSEGVAALDAVRAARQLTGTSGKSVIWGHSQGGGASLWAAELAPTYAPDANVVGAIAGAPAVELKLLGTVLRTSPFFGYLFMAAGGFRAAYPDIDLSTVFTPAGIEATVAAENACYETIAALRGKPSADYITADLAAVEPIASYLEDNTPGNIATAVPIFVYQGEKDEQIPVAGSLLLLNRACKVGGFTMVRKTYPDGTHTSVIPMAMADIKAFATDRLAGAPVTPTPCPPA
jgi:pimeloyl-ACP methyl ester carboxylesterase